MRLRFDRARYPARALCLPVEERDVQDAIVAYLRARRALVMPIDAGARALRASCAGRAAHGAVAPKGLPDVLAVLEDGRLVVIEVKRPAWLAPTGRQLRPAGKPTPEQEEWLRALERRGALACVAWGVEDVRELVG